MASTRMGVGPAGLPPLLALAASKEVKGLLDDEDCSILLAIKVSKSQASATVFGRRGRIQSKPRILAVSAKRGGQSQRYSVKVHVIKTSQLGMQLAKSYKMSSLSSIEAVTSDKTGRSFLLVFDQKSASQQPQWTTRSIDDRNHLMVCLLKMSRENLGRMPKVAGIDVVEMALWAQKHAKPLLPAGGGAGGPGGGPGGGGARSGELGGAGGAGGDEAGGSYYDTGEAETAAVTAAVMQQDLVSKAEEDDMEALLGTYVIGIDEAEAFSERLKRELGALEAANVHAILESEALVQEVVDRLDGAAESTQDMDEWLHVFHLKLRHMRQDIESIEARNNMLEVQARNDTALLDEVDSLLRRLRTPAEYAAALTTGGFEEAALPQLLEACAWLMATHGALNPPGLEREYSSLGLIREKRAEIEKLRAVFVQRAAKFLRHHLAAVTEPSSDKRGSKGGPPDHKELRRKINPYAPLVRQLKALDASSVADVRSSYCQQAMTLLLRREMREYAGELKVAAKVAAGGAAGGADADTAAVSEAYAKLLRIFLPLLADEAAFFLGFCCLQDGAGEQADDAKGGLDAAELKRVEAAVAQLLDGTEEDLMAMADWGAKVDPVRGVTMTGLTDHWLSVYGSGGGSGSSGNSAIDAYLHRQLSSLHLHIRKQFFKFVEEVQADIDKYNRGVKYSGVLPFIPRFAELALRLEAAVHGSARDVVDQAYHTLVAAMFGVLEQIARVDARSADVLLLENYAAFQNSMYDLATGLPVLRSFYQQASEGYESACARYIEDVILQQFGPLLDFKDKVQGQLSTIEAEEIQFQVGLSKADMRQVVQDQLSQVEDVIDDMQQRMRASLTSDDLLPSLWGRCQDEFLADYKELEDLIATCYSNEQLSPSALELADIFRSMSE